MVTEAMEGVVGEAGTDKFSPSLPCRPRSAARTTVGGWRRELLALGKEGERKPSAETAGPSPYADKAERRD